MSRSKERRAVFISCQQMREGKRVRTQKIPLPKPEIDPVPVALEASALTIEQPSLQA